MSTDNLDQSLLDTAASTAKALHADAKRRRENAKRQANNIQTERAETKENFRVAANAVDQRFQDRQATIGEELEQLDAIFDNQPPTPTAPPPAQPAPEPQPPVDPPTQPLPSSVHVVPGMKDDPWPIRRHNNADPRHWRGLAWLLAIVGAVVGLVVARATFSPMWKDVKSDGWHSLFVSLWFVALILAGFFTGGWIGASIEKKRSHDQQNPPVAA